MNNDKNVMKTYQESLKREREREKSVKDLLIPGLSKVLRAVHGKAF